MVEKWLLQVEEAMIQSIRKVIADSIEAYLLTVREKWVLDWPGQVSFPTNDGWDMNLPIILDQILPLLSLIGCLMRCNDLLDHGCSEGHF